MIVIVLIIITIIIIYIFHPSFLFLPLLPPFVIFSLFPHLFFFFFFPFHLFFSFCFPLVFTAPAPTSFLLLSVNWISSSSCLDGCVWPWCHREVRSSSLLHLLLSWPLPSDNDVTQRVAEPHRRSVVFIQWQRNHIVNIITQQILVNFSTDLILLWFVLLNRSELQHISDLFQSSCLWICSFKFT